MNSNLAELTLKFQRIFYFDAPRCATIASSVMLFTELSFNWKEGCGAVGYTMVWKKKRKKIVR